MATKLTPRQIVEISDLLKQHIQQLPDGFVKYTNGMNDGKIAKLVGVGYWHVINVRRSAYGNMHKAARTAGKEDLQQQIIELQQRLDAIESFMQKDWGYELSSTVED